MRVFDWEAFVNREGIEHITKGANVGRGEIERGILQLLG